MPEPSRWRPRQPRNELEEDDAAGLSDAVASVGQVKELEREKYGEKGEFFCVLLVPT